MNSSLLIIPVISTLAGCGVALMLRSVMLNRAPSLLQNIIPAKGLSFAEGTSREPDHNSFQHISPFIEQHIDEFLRHKLGKEMPMIGMFIGDKTISQLKVVFMQELEEMFPVVMDKYFTGISPAAVKLMIKKAARRELQLIPVAGAIAGLATGLLQLLLLWILG